MFVTQRMYYLLVRMSSENRTRCSVKGFSLPGAADASSVTKFLPKRPEDGWIEHSSPPISVLKVEP